MYLSIGIKCTYKFLFVCDMKFINLICSYEIDFGSLSILMEVYTGSAFDALPILQNKHYAMIERYLGNWDYAFLLISGHKPSEDITMKQSGGRSGIRCLSP